MQYQLESPSKKSVTSAIIPDGFNFTILNGEIYQRTDDTFVCVGPLNEIHNLDAMERKTPKRRETMAEQMHRMHGLPTFPASPSGTAEASIGANQITQAIEAAKK